MLIDQYNILFVSHSKQKCGVYQFGKNVYDVIKYSEKYKIDWAECDNLETLHKAIKEFQPSLIIYNYHPATMPWLSAKISPRLYRSNVSKIEILQIGIIHEITQEVSDKATNYRNQFVLGKRNRLTNVLFDFYIAADPTLLLKNPIVFKTGRLIHEYKNEFPISKIPTIGSYGFGTPSKGFENIVLKVQEEFDEAIIRFNIPFADFGDPDGLNAIRIKKKCESLIYKKNITLQITHDFLDGKEILDYLAQNTINLFLYEDLSGRGLSSAIDNALSVQRPIGVSESVMFRHLLKEVPSISINKSSIKNLIDDGFKSIKFLLTQWDKSNLLWEYERIIGSAISRYNNPVALKMGMIRTLQSVYRRFFSIPDKSFTWLRNTESANTDSMDVDYSLEYMPLVMSNEQKFNRILDDSARKLYKGVIEKLFEIVPKTMSKKIAEANVQQAFVFDTVFRNLKNYNNPKLLCVGCYEDTASMGLKKMGVPIEEIDPMINYYLQEYISKPTTVKNSYDIIFSTSVIEHDPDDESFVRCIHDLLAPNGIAIITCDYNNQWSPGDLKPDVDERLYTENDLKFRLLNQMPRCTLIDTPDWDCPTPDFIFLGKYKYTFATFVVKKVSN